MELRVNYGATTTIRDSASERGRMKLHTFLNYGGNCEQALRFYEQHLGGKITMLMRRAEQPDQPVTWPGWRTPSNTPA